MTAITGSMSGMDTEMSVDFSYEQMDKTYGISFTGNAGQSVPEPTTNGGTVNVTNNSSVLNLFSNNFGTFTGFSGETETPTGTTSGKIQYTGGSTSATPGPVTWSGASNVFDNVLVTGTAYFNGLGSNDEFLVQRGQGQDLWATTELSSINGDFGEISFGNKDFAQVNGSGNAIMVINYGAINQYGVSNPLIFPNLTFNPGGGTNTVVPVGDGNFTLTNGELTNSGTSGIVYLDNVKVANFMADNDNDGFNLNGWTGTGSITGGTGTNSLSVTKNANFTLGNSTVSSSDGMSMSFSKISNFTLTAGGTTNEFDVSGFHGKATINGDGGINAITATKSANYVLNGDTINSSDGMFITVTNVPRVLLFGGAGGQTYNIESWFATGAITLYGGSGNDSYILGNGDIDNVAASVAIRDIGGSNILTVIDEDDSKQVNYQLTGANQLTGGTFTSTLQSNGGSRTFPGLAVTYGSLSHVTLDSNLETDNINVTPSAITTFTINSFSNGSTSANYLYVSGVAAATYVTGSTLGTGTFVFPLSTGIQPVVFKGITSTNYTGVAGDINAVAPDAGTPDVIIVNAVNDQPIRTFSNVYPAADQGGVRVAIGYVTPDGLPDLIVAPGRGMAPEVEVYSILTGNLLESFLGDVATDTNGLLVAVGHVTGSSGPEAIITAPSVGTANVHVFLNNGTATPFTGYSSSTPTIQAFANDSGYAGGVGGLAVANLPGTTAGDIIVGSGTGLPAQAQVFNYALKGTSNVPYEPLTPLFSSQVSGGVSVAAGLVNGAVDVIFGAGPGAASQVDVDNLTAGTQNQFTAFSGSGSNAAVRVALTQVSATTTDLLVGQGPNGQSQELKVFTTSGGQVSTTALDTLMANDSNLLEGVYLG